MVLDTFILFENKTHLIAHRNTVYKLKIEYNEVTSQEKDTFTQKVSNLSAHDEIESALRAVLYKLEREEPLIPMQTEHFIIFPKTQNWELGQKVQFRISGKHLHCYENLVTFKIACNNASEPDENSPASQKKQRLDQDQPHENSGSLQKKQTESKEKHGSNAIKRGETSIRPCDQRQSHPVEVDAESESSLGGCYSEVESPRNKIQHVSISETRKHTHYDSEKNYDSSEKETEGSNYEGDIDLLQTESIRNKISHAVSKRQLSKTSFTHGSRKRLAKRENHFRQFRSRIKNNSSMTVRKRLMLSKTLICSLYKKQAKLRQLKRGMSDRSRGQAKSDRILNMKKRKKHDKFISGQHKSNLSTQVVRRKESTKVNVADNVTANSLLPNYEHENSRHHLESSSSCPTTVKQEEGIEINHTNESDDHSLASVSDPRSKRRGAQHRQDFEMSEQATVMDLKSERRDAQDDESFRISEQEKGEEQDDQDFEMSNQAVVEICKDGQTVCESHRGFGRDGKMRNVRVDTQCTLLQQTRGTPRKNQNSEHQGQSKDHDDDSSPVRKRGRPKKQTSVYQKTSVTGSDSSFSPVRKRGRPKKQIDLYKKVSADKADHEEIPVTGRTHYEKELSITSEASDSDNSSTNDKNNASSAEGLPFHLNWRWRGDLGLEVNQKTSKGKNVAKRASSLGLRKRVLAHSTSYLIRRDMEPGQKEQTKGLTAVMTINSTRRAQRSSQARTHSAEIATPIRRRPRLSRTSSRSVYKTDSTSGIQHSRMVLSHRYKRTTSKHLKEARQKHLTAKDRQSCMVNVSKQECSDGHEESKENKAIHLSADHDRAVKPASSCLSEHLRSVSQPDKDCDSFQSLYEKVLPTQQPTDQGVKQGRSLFWSLVNNFLGK